jgi:hypothetical protein
VRVDSGIITSEEMEIAAKEAQNMDMDESDSQMEYDEEVNLTTPQLQRGTGRQPKKRKTERM